MWFIRTTVSRHMPLHSFSVFGFYRHSCLLTGDGKIPVAKIILHITEKLRQVKKSKTPKCVEALGGVFEGTLCILQNEGFCLCCPADGLILPWYKCFGLPFAEIIIIVVMTMHFGFVLHLQKNEVLPCPRWCSGTLQAAAGKVALPWPFHTVTQPQRPSSRTSM